MPAKKTKSKAAAKRPAPKRKATTKAKAKPGAKGGKKAPPPQAKAKKSAPSKKRSARARVAAPPSETLPVEPAVETAVAETAPAEETKKGPLARLAGSVGNLFARVTGKKPDEPEQPTRSDQTIELSSDDVLAATSTPPPTPKSK